MNKVVEAQSLMGRITGKQVFELVFSYCVFRVPMSKSLRVMKEQI